jgi:hypothetical protein
MPTVQGAFPIRQDAFVAGQAAKSRYSSDSSVVVTNPINFGAAVQRAGDGGIAPLVAGGVFFGIAKRDQGRPISQSGDRYEVGAVASYFTAGHIVVVADKAIATLDVQARFNVATGRFTDAAASGTVIDAGAFVFDSITTAAGQLVVIRRA